MSSVNHPLVTICISTYNRMHLLPKAVDAVLKQSYQDFELIIVNDCSPDETDEVVKALLLKDERITYIKHEINKGLAAARNTAIINAKGKYFTFIDDDDLWAETFIEEFVQVAEQYDENWCFCCGSMTVDAIGQTVYGKFNHLEGELLTFVKAGYTPPVASQFYFTSTLKKYGGYNEQIQSGVDHDLWLTLAFHGVKIKSVDKYLAFPAKALDAKRSKMTNAYDKRMRGLNHAFVLWQDKISTHLGNNYYYKFVQAYLIREKKKFFRLYLYKFNFSGAYQLYRELGEEISSKEVLKSLLLTIIIFLKIRIRRVKYSIKGPNLNIMSS